MQNENKGRKLQLLLQFAIDNDNLGSFFEETAEIQANWAKLSYYCDKGRFLVRRLHISIQNSSRTFNVPMFFHN